MTISYPSFYSREQIGTLFYPNMAQIASEAKAAMLTPAEKDKTQSHLLIIDMQVDFCHENGSLYVPGSLVDLQRLIDFIFKVGNQISQISCTLDSHLPYQIFHPSWWVDKEGNNPEPLTMITAVDLEQGKWQAPAMSDHSAEYVQQLEQLAKKQLTIWPFHVLIGGLGNMLDPALWTAVMWHSLARNAQPNWIPKGTLPQTEHYSAIQPEIPLKGQPNAGKNQALLDSIEASDVLFVAGEAKSHCVLETLEDIVESFKDDPEKLQKIVVLQDCMSSVQHPAVDFDAIAEERFAIMAQAGVNFIDSTNDEVIQSFLK